MKKNNLMPQGLKGIALVLITIVLSISVNPLKAQDTAAKAPAKVKSYVKNTFEGGNIIDNQTVIVPVKHTLEFDFQHRFGTINNGWKDLFGVYAVAAVRLSLSYTPINNLQLGFGSTNEKMIVDWNAKWAALKQTTNNSMPVSVTLYGNVAMDTRIKDNTTYFVTTGDRLSYYGEIMVARKFTEAFSVQAAASLAHFNNLQGYLDVDGNVQPIWKNDNISFELSGRYKITPKTAIIVDYDQPLTQNPANNPHPNLSFGFDFKTSGHDFQVFFGNYGSLIPQNNALYNQNDYQSKDFLLGFNISRLWNF